MDQERVHAAGAGVSSGRPTPPLVRAQHLARPRDEALDLINGTDVDDRLLNLSYLLIGQIG